jgi:F-type H+-transporting ATPase subunit gamma
VPALIDIRRRIRSVKNTQQITKAMKMVSAAKLRRAQEAMFAARPYARKMMEVLNSLATRAQPDLHPLLQEHGDKRVLLIVVTSDKGLCGGFNANIVRTAVRFLEERPDKDVQLEPIGRKGRDFFKRRRWKIRNEHVGIFQNVKFAAAKTIAQDLIRAYTTRELDEIYLLYNEFKSVIQQRIVVERLLPIEKLQLQPTEPAMDYLYEPKPAEIFAQMLPRHVEIQVFRALLESAAAEHGPRWTPPATTRAT